MRKIIHIDADCFFASVELRRRPHLSSKPFAVGGSPEGRGVITTCNYIARTFGVRSAMASSHALKLCPDLHFVRPEMSLYKQASQQMFDIFRRYSDKVETVSIDEAYIDVTEVALFHGSATLIAQDIQRCVKQELDLPVSAGIASLKFLAKIASDWNKPQGIFTVPPEAALDFIATLPLNRLPGVGPRTYAKLNEHNLRTCQDVRRVDKVFLAKYFGVFGLRLLQMSEGVDAREVKNSRSRKSLSVEHTFDVNIADNHLLLAQLEPLLVQLSERYLLMKKRQKNLQKGAVQAPLFQPEVEPDSSMPIAELKPNSHADIGLSDEVRARVNAKLKARVEDGVNTNAQRYIKDNSLRESLGDSILHKRVDADGSVTETVEAASLGAVVLPPRPRLSVIKYIVKLKFADFTHTTMETRATALNSAEEYEAFKRLLVSARQRSHLPVRLLGVGYKFASADSLRQLDLPFSEQ